MLDILSDYLRENAPPELRHTLEAAYEALDRIELPNYEQGFEDLLMLDDQADQGATLDKIVELTRDILSQLLRQHEITLIHDVSLEMMVVFINGILDIQDYENDKEVIQTCDLDVNPNEKLCELLALVTSKSVEELLCEIEDVNPVLMKRIGELMAERNQPKFSDEELAQVQVYVDRLKAFMNWASLSRLRITDLIKNGMDVGWPFLTYMGIVGRELEEMPVDKAAYELMGMVLVSNDGSNNPQSIIKQYLENYVSDINKITKIDIKLREIVLGLQR